MFAGDYKIILNKGNYIPQDTIDFRINKGKNYKVFEVLPYIRIVNPDIRYKGNKVVAKIQFTAIYGRSGKDNRSICTYRVPCK